MFFTRAMAICIRSILYDANKPGELSRAEEFGADILKLCVKQSAVFSPVNMASASRNAT